MVYFVEDRYKKLLEKHAAKALFAQAAPSSAEQICLQAAQSDGSCHLASAYLCFLCNCVLKDVHVARFLYKKSRRQL